MGAPSAGLTSRWVVDGPELDGLGFGVERVGLRAGTDVLVRGAGDVCVALGDAVGVGVGVLERARVGALDEHAAVTPRTQAAPTTRPARRTRRQRLTRPP